MLCLSVGIWLLGEFRDILIKLRCHCIHYLPRLCYVVVVFVFTQVHTKSSLFLGGGGGRQLHAGLFCFATQNHRTPGPYPRKHPPHQPTIRNCFQVVGVWWEAKLPSFGKFPCYRSGLNSKDLPPISHKHGRTNWSGVLLGLKEWANIAWMKVWVRKTVEDEGITITTTNLKVDPKVILICLLTALI